MTLEQLSAFFGWMTVLNVVWLGLAWLFLWAEWPWMTLMLRRILPLPPERIEAEYLHWLALYELFIYVFNLMPWLALQIVLMTR